MCDILNEYQAHSSIRVRIETTVLCLVRGSRGVAAVLLHDSLVCFFCGPASLSQRGKFKFLSPLSTNTAAVLILYSSLVISS